MPNKGRPYPKKRLKRPGPMDLMRARQGIGPWAEKLAKKHEKEEAEKKPVSRKKPAKEGKEEAE